MKNINLNNYLKKQLKSKTFKKEWQKTEVQYQFVRQLIKTRLKKKISQRDLAKKAQTTQAVISRIESGSVNPSLNILDKLANALGKKLTIALE
ncbi:helix-turn-helix transcriptional regulator [Patescibacteria group bacterium]|nr:helix-turn-helix transcriptional regulator [Patescibacteria group bacterium]